MRKYQKINDNNKNVISKFQKQLNKVIRHGNFILGPEIKKLESKLSSFTGSKYCVTTSSGTDSLLISLMALDIKKGDEVITSPFSWISTIEVISFLGATPKFADIDPESFNIDSDKIKKLITKKTKAIMPVSLFGQCADMDRINIIANKFKIPVIEDAAQSFGSKYKNKSSCNLSTIGCTSFFPTKPLGSFGDAGACFTNNKRLYEKMMAIRNHGQKNERYNYEFIGLNGRMDTLQASILLEKLKKFKKTIKKRNQIGKYYNYLMKDFDFISTPHISEFNYSVYAQYTIKIENRDKIMNELFKRKIPTSLFYPKPLHKVKYLNSNNKKLKVVENVCKKVLSLPMNEYLSKNDQKMIVKSLVEVHDNL
tara:strand:+ start:736 stop:1836 length:1101 start_codon:yes stop_codon:yes gene_type:complete